MANAGGGAPTIGRKVSRSLALNDDFLDLLIAFDEHDVDYVVIGAHALAVHGVVRATGDLDILVRPGAVNAARVMSALRAFGAPVGAHGLHAEDLARPGTVYQMGLPPRRIDVLNEISGLPFEEVWERRMICALGDLKLPVISRADLVTNKAASGRPKDLLDLELLREAAVEDEG